MEWAKLASKSLQEQILLLSSHLQKISAEHGEYKEEIEKTITGWQEHCNNLTDKVKELQDSLEKKIADHGHYQATVQAALRKWQAKVNALKEQLKDKNDEVKRAKLEVQLSQDLLWCIWTRKLQEDCASWDRAMVSYTLPCCRILRAQGRAHAHAAQTFPRRLGKNETNLSARIHCAHMLHVMSHFLV